MLKQQKAKLRVVFFSVNGSGLGHLTRCLAYARQLPVEAEVIFFSLASALEFIEKMFFVSEYYISHFWTISSTYDWNQELAVRFGMMLELAQPQVVVFDGTWPFQGFLAACHAYGRPLKMVWSNRGLLKAGTKNVPVDESLFDLIIHPGELGQVCEGRESANGTRLITVPPVTLLKDSELACRQEARRELSLDDDARYALVSLGSGNLKDVSGIGHRLIQRLQSENIRTVWARPPISVQDMALPYGVIPVSVYPLSRYLRAFDVIVGASGYNTCCEVVQAQIPSLLIPNTLLADDQARRARMVAAHAPAVVSACETPEEIDAAVKALLALVDGPRPVYPSIPMNGAEIAAEAILKLAAEGHRS